jgi:hypothetical protein
MKPDIFGAPSEQTRAAEKPQNCLDNPENRANVPAANSPCKHPNQAA